MVNSFLFSATVVGTDTVSSGEQVQCLTEWATGSAGKALTLGGDTLTVRQSYHCWFAW